MTGCFLAFGLALVASVVLTLAVRWAARRLGVVDKPDHYRKVHQRDVPLLGGVAIYLGFLTPIVVLLLVRRADGSALVHGRPGEVRILAAAAALALLTGLVDDVWRIRARWKLIGQAIAASLAFAGGYAISVVSNPFGEPIALGLLSYPVTLLWFIGCMNAVNLLDGLDGLAAGVCLFASLTLLLVSLTFGHALTVLLMACLAGAVLGFLAFNFHPATIFLGDSGSLVLGFLVAALALQSARKSEAVVALLIPFVALGVPIFDTALAILRRWSRRLPISAADRQHVHHVLLAMGLSHRQVVLLLYAACVALGAVATFMTASRDAVSAVMLAALILVALVCVRVLGGMRFGDLWRRLNSEWKERRRVADARISVERTVARMRTVTDVSTLWQAFCAGLEGLGLDFAELRLQPAGGTAPLVLSWKPGRVADPPGEDPAETWLGHFRLQCNGHMFGQLDLGKSIETGPLLPDAPGLVDRLRGEMASHVERLSSGSGTRVWRLTPTGGPVRNAV